MIISVVGVDPGPTTGITLLHWDGAAAERTYIWQGYQCDAGSAPRLLNLLLEQEAWTAGQIEHFVHGNLPNSPTTVRLENELAEVAADWELPLARRPMAAVKTWASDTRMARAGAWKAIPAKMVDARAAGRHALYAAVRDAGVPRPDEQESESSMSLLFDDSGSYRLCPAGRTCARCHHVLVDEDELGPYYQVPVSQHMWPLGPDEPDATLTFMDRVHECEGHPHQLPAGE